MEYIRQAVELAKARAQQQRTPDAPAKSHPLTGQPENAGRSVVLRLDPSHLEAMRIVSHDVMDWRAKPFDILRTQVLQAMEAQKWHVLALTSPTSGCGKTVTSVNLGLSIARQPESRVLLIDMDLQRPRVAAMLGVNCSKGMLGVLEGRTSISDAIVDVKVGRSCMSVLPCEAATTFSSDWMASREMLRLIQEIRQKFSSHTVIFDLPPILSSNDVITILPKIDCVLMVAAVGISTTSDIEQSTRYLQSAEVIRVVLNKAPAVSTAYYYDY